MHDRLAMKRKYSPLEKLAYRATNWVGTTHSLIAHTLFFIISFLFVPVIGFSNVLLIVTTVVSLEAIYLSIFIQMSLNKHGQLMKDVQEDIEDLQEDIDDIAEDIEPLDKNIAE